MDERLVRDVFGDEEFVKRLLELEEASEVQAALKEKDIELTLDEIMQLREEILKHVKKAEENGDTLSMEQLDEVAGGSLAAALVVVLGGALIVTCIAGYLVDQVKRIRW